MSIISSQCCNWSLGGQEHLFRGRFNKFTCSGDFGLCFPCKRLIFFNGQSIACNNGSSSRINGPIFSSSVDDGAEPDDSEDEPSDDSSYEDDELIEMFNNIPPVSQNLMYQGSGIPNGGKEVDQKFEKGDICPICLDPLENGKDLDFCRYWL